jgi:hypothetical protein
MYINERSCQLCAKRDRVDQAPLALGRLAQHRGMRLGEPKF